MSCCVALMLAWRSEREPVSPDCAASILRPAARRFTSLRTRTVAMTPKATMAVAANTSTLTISVGSSKGMRSKIASMASDLEADHAVHDVVSRQHPGAGGAQRVLGERDVPYAGVEVGGDSPQDDEQHDRHRRQQDGGETALRGQRLHLAPHLEAQPDHGGQVLQDFAELAAGRRLDRHGGDEQRQILLADAAAELAHGALEVGAVGDLVGHDAE